MPNRTQLMRKIHQKMGIERLCEHALVQYSPTRRFTMGVHLDPGSRFARPKMTGEGIGMTGLAPGHAKQKTRISRV